MISGRGGGGGKRGAEVVSRNSAEYYTNIMVVHKQTIDNIALGISSLKCDCESLQNLGWDDFQRVGDVVPLPLSGYIVMPVASRPRFGDRRTFYAWVCMRISSSVGPPNCSSEYTLS